MSQRKCIRILSLLLVILFLTACNQATITSVSTPSLPATFTDEPTAELTDEPTPEPTDEPTVEPTKDPTPESTDEPTIKLADSPTSYELNNYDISFELIQPSDETTESLDSTEVQLKVEEVQFEKGDTLSSLLMGVGIFPNAEAYGALYRLNPNLDPETIEPGTTLRVPTFKGSDSLLVRIKEGKRLLISFDTTLKKNLEETIKRINALSPEFSSLPSSSFPTVDDQDTAVMQVEQIVGWLRIVRVEFKLRSRPLNSDMLRQIQGEAELLESIMKNAVEQQEQLTEEDIDLLSKIHENMKVRMATFNEAMGPGDPPSRGREVLVQVRILDPKTGQEVDQIRVYYVSEALYSKRDKYAEHFHKLSSPIEQWLPEADYNIWAQFPSFDDRIATDVLSVKVRKQSDDQPMIVEVQLLQ